MKHKCLFSVWEDMLDNCVKENDRNKRFESKILFGQYETKKLVNLALH